MGRLIEVQHTQGFPSGLTIKVGDLLIFGAAGGRDQSGATAIEILGPFIRSVVGENGQILSPMGPPNALLVLGRQPGRATLHVITGDPWHEPKTTIMDVTVEP